MEKTKLKIKKIKPLFTKIVTTADRYSYEDSISDTGIIQANVEGGIKDVQTVLAIGDTVRDIKVGDKVALNFSSYERRKYSKDSMKSSMDELYNNVVSYAFNFLEVDGKECLLLDSRDVEFIIEDFEEEVITLPEVVKKEASKATLVKPKSSLIV